jgi:putative ABC transport system permease protein
MRTAVSDWLNALLNADLYIATQDFAQGATLPDSLPAQVAHLQAVSALSRYRSRKFDLDGRPLTLIGADLAQPSRQGFRFVDIAPAQAWAAYDRGAVLISEPLANRLGSAAGGRIVLPSPSGERSYAVGGVFRDFASEHGRLFMPWRSYREAWRDRSSTTLALFSETLAPGQLKQQVLRSVPAAETLLLTEAGVVYQESMAVFERTFRITNVLRWLSLGVAIVGILSALMAIQLQRRKEFAVLRALGMTRRQLAALIVAESVLLGAVAALMSVPTGILMAWVLTEAVQFRAFGWTMPLTLDLAPQLLNLGLGLLAAALAALYPAWSASRSDPAPHLRED